jgi:hypothetical protein
VLYVEKQVWVMREVGCICMTGRAPRKHPRARESMARDRVRMTLAWTATGTRLGFNATTSAMRDVSRLHYSLLLTFV